jgi:hypothetical protein
MSPNYTLMSESEVFNCVILYLQLPHGNKCLYAQYALMEVRYLFEDWRNSYNHLHHHRHPFQYYAYWDIFWLLAYFPDFEKMKVRLCDLYAVWVSPLINLWMAEPIFMKQCMYITAPRPISTANSQIPPISLCLYIPLPLLGNGSVKRYPDNEYTHNNRTTAGLVFFYAVRVVSK